ncbi:hypothetical protein GCM10023093_04810 [Nemorincola caseinilytica]|uniref:Uncharacterized protein n=1 Tax=Nemorincola caseinilytica TaxID=2054315 RepID=A0ABP8N719_9BACT
MFLQFDINKDANDELVHQKLALINEETSPLMRMMWIYNADEPNRRTFENNICTFHIGNGYFLSVAHNLRMQAGFVRSIDADLYRAEILQKLDGSQNRLMEQHYFTDEYTRKRYLANSDPANLHTITNILKQKRFDTRWVTLAQKGICTPHVIFQFRENMFYKDADITRQFDANMQLYDADAHKYTFMLPVELVAAYYTEDVALYRIVDTPAEVIAKIPSLPVCYDLLEEDNAKLYCLQSSPGGAVGRLLNIARIEGLLDHFGVFQDDIGGNYLFERYRYLIKGYFRFGSSGAPYLYYNSARNSFVINAIQSEASGVQLSIKNDREGNYQYVNAIATPLHVLKDSLQSHIGRV